MKNSMKNFKIAIFLFGVTNLLFHWDVKTSVLTDITGSRTRYITGQGDSFLGAMSAVFYGNLPNEIINWWQLLLLFQTILVSAGIYFIFYRRILDTSFKSFCLILFFSFLVINLGVGQSRDGLMIAGTTLAIGILIRFPRNLWSFMIASGVYVFVFAFRPWLALSMLPIIYCYLRRSHLLPKIFSFFICIFLIVLPTLTEAGTSKIWRIKPGYPQQTVFIHDLASTYCLTPIQNTKNLARKVLLNLSNDSKSFELLCDFYLPNTWQSTTSRNMSDPVLADLNSPITSIAPGNDELFKVLQDGWIKVVLSDPKTYLQIRAFFLTQVLLGGDSTSIDISGKFQLIRQDLSFKNIENFLTELYDVPWKLVLILHLITPLAIIFLLMVIFWRSSSQSKSPNTTAIAMTFCLWIGITTIGFVSDNGRYTYLPTLLLIGNLLWEKPFKKRNVI